MFYNISIFIGLEERRSVKYSKRDINNTAANIIVKFIVEYVKVLSRINKRSLYLFPHRIINFR